jgi:catechol 2,3-dioxygenase
MEGIRPLPVAGAFISDSGLRTQTQTLMYSPHLYPITKALGFVALGVPDLALATEEAQQIHGLRLTHSEGDSRFFSANDRRFELILTQAAHPALETIGLEATDENSLDLLKSRLTDAKVHFSNRLEPYPGIAKAVRFSLPSGHTMELHSPAGPTTQSFDPTPAADAPPTRSYGAPASPTKQGDQGRSRGARPRRLGHALLKVENVPLVEQYLRELLSFRVSDRALDGRIVWLRCSEIHHSINLLQGPAGLHHYAWEVDDWAVFKRLGDILHGHGRQLVWGPGRHGPGRNLFTYHADSTGALVEYFTDIARIENEETYQWRDWSDVPEWNNIWGPLPPTNFPEYGIPLRAAAGG